MNWKNRYRGPQPGSRVKVIKIASGDIPTFKIGDILTLKDGSGPHDKKTIWKTEETASPIYTTEFEVIG